MSRADTRIAIGKSRESGGQRAWRAALYTPAGRYTLYRVTFKKQTEDGWTCTARTAPTEADAADLHPGGEGPRCDGRDTGARQRDAGPHRQGAG